jgi:hypothetical protein
MNCLVKSASRPGQSANGARTSCPPERAGANNPFRAILFVDLSVLRPLADRMSAIRFYS